MLPPPKKSYHLLSYTISYEDFGSYNITLFSYSCSIAADYNSTKSDIKKYGPYNKVLLIGNEVTKGLRFQCFINLCNYLCNDDDRGALHHSFYT